MMQVKQVYGIQMKLMLYERKHMKQTKDGVRNDGAYGTNIGGT